MYRMTHDIFEVMTQKYSKLKQTKGGCGSFPVWLAITHAKPAFISVQNNHSETIYSKQKKQYVFKSFFYFYLNVYCL